MKQKIKKSAKTIEKTFPKSLIGKYNLKRKPKFILDCVKYDERKLPEYNGLYDGHLASYLEQSTVRKLLVHQKLVILNRLIKKD